jgi:ribonuclease-3
MQTVERFQHLLNYTFKDPAILLQALTHTSYGHEQFPNKPVSHKDNERLEFLGDAILDAVVSDLLQENFAQANEGQLSKMRAAAVNEKTLAEIGKKIEIDQWVRLGKGESLSGGNQKPSILASTFEALVAAIYLDGGFNAAYDVIKTLFNPMFSDQKSLLTSTDHKTLLQEKVQGKHKITPTYHMIDAKGPDHAKTFSVEVRMNGAALAQAEGPSKKEAEQNAAKAAMKWVDQ